MNCVICKMHKPQCLLEPHQRRREAAPLTELPASLSTVQYSSSDERSLSGMQVPQYLLEAAAEAGSGAACSVICTQPRRIAAISVAERVADERGEPPPGKPGARVK